MGVVASGWSDSEEKGGVECWNTDETGLGDNRSGWATFILKPPTPGQGALVRMKVWGESELSTVTVNTGGQGKSYADNGIWTPITPRTPLVKKATWQWLEFEVPTTILPRAIPLARW